MKRLMFMISTEGKTAEQIVVAAKEAWAKYQKVSKKVKNKIQQKTPDHGSL